MSTAFVLGGGGRWGAVEVGMIQALEEADIKPDLILGTSIGAFNGAVIADHPGAEGVERLTGFWKEAIGSSLFKNSVVDRLRRVATLKPSLHDTTQLRSAIEHAIDPSKDRRPPCSLSVCRSLDRDRVRALVRHRAAGRCRPGVLGRALHLHAGGDRR